MPTTRLPNARLLSALTAVLIALVVGGGCGGDDGPTPFQLVSAARQATLAADSARVAIEVESTGSVLTGSQPVTLDGEGAFDFEEKMGSLTVDLSALGLPGAGGKVPMVLAGDVFYIKLPAGLGLGAKPWLKLDVKALGGQLGIDLSSLQQVGRSDPTSALNYLEGVAEGDVKEVGKEEVRGTDTTHLRMTVDLERAKAEVSEGLRDDYDQIIDQLGRSTFPAELWVDGDDRVRRLRFTLEQPASEGATASSVTITQELFDFGTKVTATVPPADQVTDFAELFQSLTGG